jgi:hypothetical protein
LRASFSASSLRLRPERVFTLVPTADDEGRRRRGVHGWGRCRQVLLPAAFWDVYDHGAALLNGRFVPLALTVLAPVIVNIVTGQPVLTDRRFNTNSSTSRSALPRGHIKTKRKAEAFNLVAHVRISYLSPDRLITLIHQRGSWIVTRRRDSRGMITKSSVALATGLIAGGFFISKVL